MFPSGDPFGSNQHQGVDKEVADDDERPSKRQRTMSKNEEGDDDMTEPTRFLEPTFGAPKMSLCF